MEQKTTVGTERVGLLGDYFDERELARELKMSLKTLHRWAEQGRGPVRSKIGRRTFYSRQAVAAWLESCEQSKRDGRRRRN